MFRVKEVHENFKLLLTMIEKRDYLLKDIRIREDEDFVKLMENRIFLQNRETKQTIKDLFEFLSFENHWNMSKVNIKKMKKYIKEENRKIEYDENYKLLFSAFVIKYFRIFDDWYFFDMITIIIQK